jgi:hypothetical protein
LTDSGNWRTANNSFDLQREAYSLYQHNSGKPTYFRYQLVGLPLSVICSGRPIELDKPHIWLKPLKPVFLRLKE